MNKKTIRDVDLSGQRVLVRVDFNVPLDGETVTDDTRITAAVPTIQAILEQKPKAVILMSHLGRPKGERKPDMSLKPTVAVLAEKLGMDVHFAEDCVGDVAEKAVEELPAGGVLILENTRYHGPERKNDPEFAAQLAKLGDIYVNDAFGSAHRAHASTEGVTQHLAAVAGLLMEKEIEFLDNAIANPARPFVAILGGAKVSDKISVIENLLSKADKVLIGGGMANTFFKAQGLEMGDSLVEDDAIETAKGLLDKSSDKLILPVDAVVADAMEADASTKTINVADGVEAGWRILDVGPETVKLFEGHLSDAETIVWNGPMGVFEMEPFAKATFAVAEAVAARSQAGATGIIGGGDSASAIQKAGLADKVTHVSTGGGASLEMLEGKELPGLAA
ncbi:MAG: phosphoglycerate kinase, partial [Chloroflexi bacterium]|nr:phosphoglycerate kinase [Chloroflexota bacterium]